MSPKQHPLSAWIDETFYEDNPFLRRRSSRVLGLLRKTLMAVPQAIAFAFTNFAAAYPRASSPHPPVPVAHTTADLVLDHWPRHPETGAERGLPYSDSSAQRIDVGEALNSVADLVFAMKEIHRVCVPGGQVVVATEPRDIAADPTILRTVTRDTLTFFTDSEHPLRARAERVSAAGLFRIESASTLRAIKQETPRVPTRIDIGSGTKLRPGYDGIDLVALPGVTIVRDVDRHGLPFSDSSISHVYTAHFLEHTSHLVFVMNEIHRVCCHNAIVEISVPSLLGPYAAADPTHRRLFNARTFSYFEADGQEYAGITKGFQILELSSGFSVVTRLRVMKDDHRDHRGENEGLTNVQGRDDLGP